MTFEPQKANLYVLVDGRGIFKDSNPDDRFARLIDSLVAANVDLIQLRDKSLSDQQLVMLGRVIGKAASGSTTKWIMNDRPDLAVVANADGVHLGQEDMPIHDARRVIGPERIIGVSTHSVEQVDRATKEGADYIGVGPTFASKTKDFSRHTGTELLKEVAKLECPPAFAIGGINLENIEQVLATGIRRIAVSDTVCNSDNPFDIATRLKFKLTSWRIP